MFTPHLCVDRFDFRVRLHSCGSRRQTPDNPEAPVVTRFHLIIGECKWLPDFRAPAKLAAAAEIKQLKREIEGCRHHAYDGEIFAIEKQLLPDDLWIAVETTLPQSCTDDHHLVTAERAFFGLEKSAF